MVVLYGYEAGWKDGDETIGNAAERRIVLRRGCESSPLAAYVHGLIKVKDLQSTPGPQQPLTLSGITEHDLQRCRSPSSLSNSSKHFVDRYTITMHHYQNREGIVEFLTPMKCIVFFCFVF